MPHYLNWFTLIEVKMNISKIERNPFYKILNWCKLKTFYMYSKALTLLEPFSLDKASKDLVITPSSIAFSFSSLYKSMPLYLHPKNKYIGPDVLSLSLIWLRLWCQKPLNGAIPDPGPMRISGIDMSCGMWKVGALKIKEVK